MNSYRPMYSVICCKQNVKHDYTKQSFFHKHKLTKPDCVFVLSTRMLNYLRVDWVVCYLINERTQTVDLHFSKIDVLQRITFFYKYKNFKT